MSALWEHRLTLDEEAIAYEIGIKRQGKLKEPWTNRNYSMGDVDEGHRHMIAAGSEIAFAKMLGIEDFVPHYDVWTSQPDVSIFEVRYSFPSDEYEPSLRLHNRDKDSSPYVLLTEGLAIRKKRIPSEDYVSHPYFAVGWAFPGEVKLEQYRDYHSGWRVPVSALRSMKELEPHIIKPKNMLLSS